MDLWRKNRGCGPAACITNMEERGKTILRGRLDGRQRNKLKGLLDMEYKPSELAEEIGVRTNLVYSVYISQGCPHRKDEWRHFVINGKMFREWYLHEYRKTKLKEDESFCRTCQKAVKIVGGMELKKGSLTYVVSHCPICGRVLAKIINCEKRRNDQ